MCVSLYQQNKKTILNINKMKERKELTDRPTWSLAAEIKLLLPYLGLILLMTAAAGGTIYLIYVV